MARGSGGAVTVVAAPGPRLTAAACRSPHTPWVRPDSERPPSIRTAAQLAGGNRRRSSRSRFSVLCGQERFGEINWPRAGRVQTSLPCVRKGRTQLLAFLVRCSPETTMGTPGGQVMTNQSDSLPHNAVGVRRLPWMMRIACSRRRTASPSMPMWT